MNHSEEIALRRAKYDRIERVTDELGRSIGVRMLKPSQRVRVEELAPGLDGTTTSVNDDRDSPDFGKTYEVPKIAPLIMAASVVEIEGLPVPFPKTRAELDAVLDRLDSEGLAAASEGLSRFAPKPEPKREGADGEDDGGEASIAKNSRGTPSSDRPAG